MNESEKATAHALKFNIELIIDMLGEFIHQSGHKDVLSVMEQWKRVEIFINLMKKMIIPDELRGQVISSLKQCVSIANTSLIARGLRNLIKKLEQEKEKAA